MRDLPLISVIVPVYNVENVLHFCVDSILNQDYPNIEIVLVDDGSKDKSGKLCDEYSERFSNIQSLHKENGGQSSARNFGLQKANGAFVGFIDSDDYIDRKMFSLLYYMMVKFDADITSIGCKLVGNYDCQVVEDTKINESVVFSGDEIIEYYMERGARLGDYSVCKCLFKKEMVQGQIE